MATLNGNPVYLSFDGVNLSGYWTGQVDQSASTATEDITAGAGTTHTQRAAGLSDNRMTFAVVYDTADLATYRAALVSGKQGELIYGPEGDAQGKPKFACAMILTGVDGPNPSVDKRKVQFELTFEAADAPTATIAAGGVFA